MGAQSQVFMVAWEVSYPSSPWSPVGSFHRLGSDSNVGCLVLCPEEHWYLLVIGAHLFWGRGSSSDHEKGSLYLDLPSILSISYLLSYSYLVFGFRSTEFCVEAQCFPHCVVFAFSASSNEFRCWDNLQMSRNVYICVIDIC